MLAIDELVPRYVAMWNDPDADSRRATVEALWAEDARNCTPAMDVRGHEALVARVTRSYDAYIGTGDYQFRQAAEHATHHGTAVVRWEMVRVDTGEVASIGTEFLILTPDGRIAADYQYPQL
jgi:hypothetical protein